MGAYNIVSPGSLVAGQPEDVSVVLANLQAIQAVLNGGLDNTNVAAGAGFAVSKLAAGAAGQVLKGVGPSYGQIADAEVAAAAAVAVAKLAAGANGQVLTTVAGVPTWAAAASTGSLDISTSNVGPSNSAVETSLYSFVLPGGTLGTNGCVVVDVAGDYLMNTGAARTLTWRIKWGGTTFIAFAKATGNASANRIPFIVRFRIMAKGTTNAQKIIGEILNYTAAGAAPAITTGIGADPTAVTAVASSPAAEPAIDSTVNQTIDVTVQSDAGTATQDVTKRYAITRKVS